MNKNQWLKILFYVNVVIVGLVIGYKIYLNFSQPEFEVVHSEQVASISSRLQGDSDYQFAVLGNINNSIGIFEQRIIPELNQADIDFVVSAGNAVSGGGEDKYRALYGSLSHLNKPYLLTFGDNEYDEFGSFRYYEHFGPHFFSFVADSTRFIFLDSTGKTPWQWQLRWLTDILRADESKHRFIFVSHPPVQPKNETLFATEDDFLQPLGFRSGLLQLVEQHSVDAVFSSHLSIYDKVMYKGTPFYITGGAGGLVLNHDNSFYHYLMVRVTDAGIEVNVNELEVGQHPVLKILESLWFFIYSLLYAGYINFILIVSALLLVSVKLYQMVFVGKSYYPDYDIDPKPWLSKPLNIVMFTNNYLPFIGGVPISIERLRVGLKHLGHKISIVAPKYANARTDEAHVIRMPNWFSFGENSEFQFAHLFSRVVRQKVKALKPDIIHVHHPFWIGSLGVYMAKRLKVPVVYTYHTRLEHYAHYVMLPGHLFRNIIAHIMVRRFANKCDSVIVPTQSVEEYLRMIGVTRPIYVQPTGIEYQRFQKVSHDKIKSIKASQSMSDDECILVSVARLSDEKNIDFMIDAMVDIRKRANKPVRLLQIGEGHQRDYLQQRIDDNGLTDCVQLVGAVPPKDMPEWYALGDLFVFASQSETQGMVILEAMAAGMPVVAVRSSGIEDVVEDDINGYKTPAKQDRWSEQVVKLINDDELRERLGKQALRFAADYSVEAFTRHVECVYGETLARFNNKDKRD
ncbi:MAG: membrane-associated protein [Idiomarina sp. T82-3]|uniref:glycosyltransferase n=1 Tax=Idiomarina TaxID=135575 RepID=UPI000795A507|nr:glycosyltransferase [Idiomarina sp. T82-3]KXS34381.1 MAG: membrane-associated protein [Idiomarina sp. T82-3]